MLEHDSSCQVSIDSGSTDSINVLIVQYGLRVEIKESKKNIFRIRKYSKSNECKVDYFFGDKYWGSTGDKEYFRNLFYVPTIWIIYIFFSVLCNSTKGP